MSKLKLAMIWVVAASLALTACGAKDETTQEKPGFSLPQSPLLAALERKVGLIAYVGPDGNVYTVDQSGKDPKQITTDGKLEQGNFHFYEFPTWSPDGKSLAFYGVQGTSETDLVSTLYTSDTEGKNLVEAYKSDKNVPIYLSWSPDSSKVTFISSITGGTGLVLNMVPAAGGDVEVLDVGSPYYWDWLPDSSGIIVHSGGPSSQDPQARLAMLTLNDGVVEDTLNLKPASFQSPALSPDGSEVLLAIESGGSNQLVLTDRLGTVEKQVADITDASAFSWAPDGKRLAYISGQVIQGIMVGKLNFVELGDELKTVEADHENVMAFFWAPDGKQVAYFVPAQAAPQEGDTSGDSGGLLLSLYVADVTNGKSKLIATYTPTSDFLRTLPYFDQYARSTTIWSPDSQNLVVSAYLDQNTPGIFVVPASGITDPRFLQAGTVGFWSAK
jgi:TolB protein